METPHFVWLVVWLPFFIFPYIGLLIIPTDFHIFQRGGPTTNQLCIHLPSYSHQIPISPPSCFLSEVVACEAARAFTMFRSNKRALMCGQAGDP